jgi:hypothetical protein
MPGRFSTEVTMGPILRSVACLGALVLASSARAATLSVSPESGPPTTAVQLDASGFSSGEYVSLLFDQETVAIVVADVQGGVHERIRVRASARPGAHVIEAVGSGGSASDTFLVRTNWSQFLFDAEHSGRNPYENVLSPKTAGKLRLLWTAQAGSSGLGGGIHTQIAVVDGVA